MNFIPKEIFHLYTEYEKVKLKELESLFKKWRDHFDQFKNETGFIIRDITADDMSFDGFYPHYFDQKLKILFIGRERRHIPGINYLDEVFMAY